MKILITGGASGLGEAITRICADDVGNQVYFTYHRAAENAASLEKEYPNSKGIACNFMINSDLERLKSQIEIMDIDVLINNAYAGECIKTYFHKIESNEFVDDFLNNVIPTVEITQAAIKCFRAKKKGKIITILTSFLINSPPLGASIYVANKAYLAELSRVWASENKKFNITSNTVSPSFMLTPSTARVDERVVEQMMNDHPLKQLLTTSEAAEVIAFLCKASQQINGIDIPINSAKI
jgi:NAD(P)-dependent dehydrogenase (short-subunit alcohol dehydrogenase family)